MSTMQNYASKQKKTTNSNSLKLCNKTYPCLTKGSLQWKYLFCSRHYEMVYMSFFFNVCQQEFCIVFYFVRIDEVVSSRKVLPQISGVLVSLLRMSKSASRYSSFFILIVHSIKHSVESDFFLYLLILAFIYILWIYRV